MDSITILLPDEIYSTHKKAFIKIRKKHNVKNWDGSSWHNNDILITTSFQKMAMKTGQPHNYDGDVLILSGNLNTPVTKELIKLSKDIGGIIQGLDVESSVESIIDNIEEKSTQSSWYANLTLEEKVEGELKNEREKLENSGMSPSFTNNYLNVHRKHLLKLYGK